ncbi:DUF3372 domain-containing protein [Schlegelella sp. S2-27]|uniref:pullulanase n=1 Tax=Caldimonas mangrovi TaxID=2944811 RepID=A0ABT0YTP4_9BURK|nr:alpha-1,6-glucosidase domain-containing protein [Caldimonas mangrovi]MCM5682106.1 DUF3372 domain-containing protein [Caldimonas mangrovi]
MHSAIKSGWRRALTVGACVAAAAWLAACGGGSGSSDDDDNGNPVPAATMRVHYQRADETYADWAVYSWSGPSTPSSGWPGSPRYVFSSTDGYGGYVDIPLNTALGKMDFLLNNANGDKDGDCDRSAGFATDVATEGQEIWLKQGDCSVYDSAGAASGLNLSTARGLWLARGTIAWPGVATEGRFRLHHAADGGITVAASGVSGADGAIELTAGALSDTLKERFRHVASAPAFELPADALPQVPAWLKGQLVLTREVDGRVAGATLLQTQGVLDDVYAAQAVTQALGVSFATDGTPVFRLWAPTARSVSLKIVGGSTLPMMFDADSGIWSVAGDKAWTNSAYYTYSVEVYSRADSALITNEVTDPYAVTLNANSQAAMVADLSEATFKPAGWDGHAVPALDAPEDSVLYELHLRDFSVNDSTVPAALRGKYKAFTVAGSDGITHLQAMAGAGLTHVHLLPVFDINTIDEVDCVNPVVAAAGAISEAPQAAVSAVKDEDCFNWGYDPRHYGAPEGSYATDATDGAVRVREFREMVQALHGVGLRVVMDVVYNHTSGNFLDRIVPGYYYRLNADGFIEKSTCCENTAPEYAMMEKLMLDTLKVWAQQYAIDGFRFDIMGHIPKSAMVRAQAETDAAAGRPLYYYGEAWNFGEVENDRQFVQARQAHLAGTGIGSFSDRIRDAIRGGGPFDVGEDMVKNQGFVSGRCYDNNTLNSGPCTDEQRVDLHGRQNLIRLGMAGSLRDFMLDGKPASDYDYGGQPAGYTSDPQEIVNYAGVHDGETLFDIGQFKHASTVSPEDRARAQVVALGTVLMGQGVPFIHAGDELLRSKSMDRDSYNSGDWFNRIDWTATTHYFGEMGLPPAEKNAEGWELMKPFLSNAAIRPGAAPVVAAREAVMDLMRVRKDSTMLRLRTGDDVKACVSFPDQASQRDGLVVMRIAGQKAGGGACGDGKYASVVVLVNAGTAVQSYPVAGYAGKTVMLHPLLAAGSDPRVKTAGFASASGTFTVPARTVAVFVEP